MKARPRMASAARSTGRRVRRGARRGARREPIRDARGPARRRTRLTVLLAAALAAALVSACGGGTAALSGGGGGGGGGKTNLPPGGLQFSLTHSEQAPATLSITLFDAESNSFDVAFTFTAPNGASGSLSLEGGQGAKSLPSSPTGVTSQLAWDFAADLGTSSLVRDVLVRAEVVGGQGQVKPGQVGAELPFDLGNDPATATIQQAPLDEIGGDVPLGVVLADSADQPVTVRLRFQVTFPFVEPWRDGTLAGAGSFFTHGAPQQTVTWASDADLPGRGAEVQLAVVVDDGFTPQAELLESAPVALTIDNNEPPQLELLEAALVSYPDDRRGVPLPIQISDAESDTVLIVAQWTRPGQPFPMLPSDLDELKTILSDASLRRQYRIATEYPTFEEGLIVPVDAQHVRLPELSSRAAGLLPLGIAGRVLDVLRGHHDPRPVSAEWSGTRLTGPVDAVPLGDGSRALLLESPTPDSAHLRQILLATGETFKDVTAGSGSTPVALDVDPLQTLAIVGSNANGRWILDRVDLETGAVTRLADQAHVGLAPGPLRDVLCLGGNATLFTAADALLLVEHGQPAAARVSLLRAGLSTPWGLALDPSDPRRVVLAEHGGGPGSSDPGALRVFHLDTHELEVLPQSSAGVKGSWLRSPSWLDFAVDDATRLAVVTQLPNGAYRLSGLLLGARGGNEVLPPLPLPGVPSSLATGKDHLVVLGLPASDDLLVGGGVVQRRKIGGIAGVGQAHQPATSTVTVNTPFDPPPRTGQRWRIGRNVTSLRARQEGVRAQFIWDSSDVLEGDVLFRIEAWDDDQGSIEASTAPKRVSLLRERTVLDPGLSGVGPAADVLATDVDGDGSIDLVAAPDTVLAAASSSVVLFPQLEPGVFGRIELPPSSLPGFPGATFRFPRSLAVADADADGLRDLLVGYGSGNYPMATALYQQLAPGSFASQAAAVTGYESDAVVLFDFDADERLDIAALDALSLDHHPSLVVSSLPPGQQLADVVLELFLGFDTAQFGTDSLVTGDLDADGRLDLLWAGPSGPRLFLPLPSGDVSDVTLAGAGVLSLAAVDLDRDGDVDLATTTRDTEAVQWYEQTAPAVFGQPPVELGGPLALSAPRAVTPADLDQDGDLDLLAGNLGSGTLALFLQGAPGEFETAPSLLDDDGGLQPLCVAVSDVDGDSRADVVVPAADGTLRVLYQTRPGTFADPPREIGSGAASEAPRNVLVRDLDADGDMDLASVHPGRSHVAIHHQLFTAVFDSAAQLVGGIGLTDGAYDIAAVDLDGDALLDLLSADSLDDRLSIHLQDPAAHGSFLPLTQHLGSASVTDDPRSLAVADTDGDGDRDVIVSSVGSDNFAIFRQLGGAQFAPNPLVRGGPDVTNEPVDVIGADLTGDARIDVATANVGSGTVTLWHFNGTGYPQVPDVVLPATGPFELRAADLDLDGDLDLVCADRDESVLRRFMKQADGSWTEAAPLPVVEQRFLIPTPGRPHTVATSDLDLDGDIDLATAARALDWVQVFEQRRPGVFVGGPQLGDALLTGGPVALEIVDVDGDGDPELVSANETGNSLSVYWNAH